MDTTTFLVSAFLFDMDGTLVDSGAVVESAWALWASRYQLDLKEVLDFSHGRPTIATMDHFGARFAPGRDWYADAEELMRFEEVQSTVRTAAIPGAAEVLSQLNGFPWAVVTSAPRHLAETRIRAAGLPLPSVLVPADEIVHGKPHPEGYLKAASELGIASRECVVFEDTPAGVEAGLAAGMPVVALLTTVPAHRLLTGRIIRDYRDLVLTQRKSRFEISWRT